MALSYLIREDDTPQRAAARNYGKWELFPLILDNNRALLKGLPDNTLPAGSILYIPEPPALTREFKHVVQDGDTYFTLATLYYEAVSFARKMEHDNNSIRLNKYIGTEIIIPALVSQRTFDNARRLLNG
jgi:hypothetical protein